MKALEGIIRILGALAFVVALCVPATFADDGPEHQAAQVRPIQLGTSGGNINDRSMLYCCSGTLGALVQNGSGTQYILSNNHVLAESNNGIIGDDINQPGQVDQNCGQTGIVADLSYFVPLQFGKGRNRPLNTADAAIAGVRSGQVRTDGSILDIGPVSADTVAAFVGQAVQKSGRTTGYTTGVVQAIDVTVDVGYSNECGGAATNVARFVNQLRITPGSFSDSGDSGSLIVESGSVSPNDGLPRAVGLLFAGSSTDTIANPIDAVLTQLGVTMVGGTPAGPPTTGSVSGVVTDASTSAPISGAAVSVDTGGSTVTGADGSYAIASVPTGTRTVSVSATGYAPASQDVTVSENTDTTANFALTPAVTASQSIVNCVTYTGAGGKNSDKHLTITVNVLDDLGNPVSGAAVDFALSGVVNTAATGTTDGTGNAAFTVKNAPDGTYQTTVTSVTASGLTFEGSTPANSFTKGTDAMPAEFCRAVSAGAVQSAKRGHAVTLNEARSAKARHSAELLALDGVVGHGIGLSPQGSPVIEVYLANENAAGRAKVPAKLDNVPVRVIVTGPFRAF